MGTRSAQEVYAERLEARRLETGRLDRIAGRCASTRLGVAAAFVILACLAWRGDLRSRWLLAPAVAFGALVVIHDRVLRSREASRRAEAFYERGLERLGGAWIGAGEPGDRFLDPAHPYAQDLDLFGKGSVFELLCTARTRAGEETLAAWLLMPSSPDEIRLRQEAVAELAPKLDLRESLASAGDAVRAGIEADALRSWAIAPSELPRRWPVAVAATSSALTTACLAAWLAGIAAWPFWGAGLLQGLLALRFRRRVNRVLRSVERPGRDLDLLSSVLGRLEAETFSSVLLLRLAQRLRCGPTSASVAIRRLQRIVDLIDSRHNQLFAPFAALVLAGTHLAHAVEAWRERHGRFTADWLAALGDMEALCALGGYAFENPSDVFPRITVGDPVFDGTAIGHPILPDAACVRNDVRLGGDTRVLIVSGSNMSGKSTLLRTVGVLAVLAQAGAPVRARQLTLSPLALGATLRIQDSLREGFSRFYKEITRLKTIADLAEGPRPLLFLLDEILHGTNSHDRQIGAEAIVRNLLDRGAIGLVTTHDLALTGIVPSLPGAANVHFEDHLEGHELRFDYRMRPGVVRKSNAIELMRRVGLSV